MRVVIVDDHPVYRQGLRAVIDATPGIELVGDAATGHEALTLVRDQRPDVVLLDLHLPDVSGIEIAQRLATDDDGPAVLILSMLDDDDSVFAAIRAGAAGYLVKGAGQDEIVHAVTTVADGGAVFGPGIARRVLGAFDAGAPAPPFPELTHREREVLDLVARGLPNAAIARELHLSVKTIMNNVSSILSKLHATDRANAIIKARDAGLGLD